MNSLQRCYHCVKYIQKLLGKPWLEEQKKQVRGQTNFLFLAWSETVEMLHHLEIRRFFLNFTPSQPPPEFELTVSPNMLYLFAVCRDLEIAETLPNFQQGVPIEMLRNTIDQPRYEYIARTATMYSLLGHQVEFVPVSVKQGERTPDLLIKFNDSDIYIECKRKDDFQVKDADKIWTKSLVEELSELRTLVIQDGDLSSEGRQIAVITTGMLSVRDKILMTDFIKERLETKETGSFKLPSGEAIVSVKAADPLPFSPALGSGYAWLPDNAHAGNATTVFRLNEDGITEILKEFKVLVYTFNSSKVSSIINSFNDARVQLPRDSFGIIHIDVDSGVAPG